MYDFDYPSIACVNMYNVFSDLPDTDDINTQVLLLGITRFETTPSPPQPVHFPLANVKQISNNGNRTTALQIASKPTKTIDQINAIGIVYQSLENLNKTTSGCFPLERHKSKTLNDRSREESSSATSLSSNRNAFVDSYRFTDQILNRTRYINRIFERFHSQKQQTNNQRKQKQQQQQQQQQNNSGAAQIPSGIERKAFYCWLNSNRRQTKRTDQCFDDNPNISTSVIRKCSSKSNSIRKLTKQSSTTRNKSSKAHRLSSCLPYCSAVRNDSIAGNSLASSHRFCEYRRKRLGLTATTAATGATAASGYPAEPNNWCTHYCNRRFDNNNIQVGNCIDSASIGRDRPHNNEQTEQINCNRNCCLFPNLNNMDRSVDSIGSCSLDVDAESTDFSDTSGSLNVCTPLSGKDFTREFTSRILERSQFPIQATITQKLQQTKTILDPNSGKISTILSQNGTPANNSPTSPVKKPSYLNLACCVNGYSNLTTYDSKLRQSINKSREVSPIRPITYAVQYNRNGDNNYLSIPTVVSINDNPTKNYMMDAHTIVSSPEKRYFSTQKPNETNGTNGQDRTDNINRYGCSKYITHSISAASATTTTTTTTTAITNNGANTSLALVREVNQELENRSASKSFIQQRVERLYGPVAVAQGLYSPKKPKSIDENPPTNQLTTKPSSTISSVLIEKSQNSTYATNSTTLESTKFILEAQRNGHVHITGSSTNRSVHDDENINLNALNEALPVLRHLRPEFRAQLPTLSPKRTIAISKLSTVALSTPTNGTSSSGKSTNIMATSNDAHNNHVSNGLSSCQQKVNAMMCNDVGEQKTTTTTTITTITTLSSVSSTPSIDAVSNNGLHKNGCLTSNKSHDIETNNCRHKDSGLPANSSTDTVTLLHKLPVNNTQNNIDITDSKEIINYEMNSPPTIEVNESIDSTDFKKLPSIEQVQCLNSNDLKSNVDITTKPIIEQPTQPIDANGNHKTEQKKDAHSFLITVHAERDRLLKMAVDTEAEVDQLAEKGEIDEESLGNLRSASGKARLLATKKFKQFEGLCMDCLNQVKRDGMPPPNPDDLQGFWDMVYLQVENVDALYAQLDQLRANGWKKPEQLKPIPAQGTKLTRRPISKSAAKMSTTSDQSSANASGTSKKSAAAIAAAQKREAQRKQLLEMKRKHKLAMTAFTNIPSDDLITDCQTHNKHSDQTKSTVHEPTTNETDR